MLYGVDVKISKCDLSKCPRKVADLQEEFRKDFLLLSPSFHLVVARNQIDFSSPALENCHNTSTSATILQGKLL